MNFVCVPTQELEKNVSFRLVFIISLFELDFKYGCINFIILSGTVKKRQLNFQKALEKYILN
jgi:hypothetical protein